MFKATTKASGGITIAFPDICKTPSVPAGVPIPYPNIARTATESQKKQTKTGGTTTTTKTSTYSRSTGDEPGTMKGIVSNKMMGRATNMASNPRVHSEIQAIKAILNQLNGKLQTMNSSNADEWQAVLQEYAVAASALYVTIHGS